jgi:tetratricopeptide (TPR) repeat protein
VIKRFLYAIAAIFLFSHAAPAAEPASSGNYLAANKLFAAEKYSEALILYKKALSSPPTDLAPGDIHNKIGDTYFRLANYRSALDAYRLAIRDQRHADRAQTQYWIGFCCYLIGRDADAVSEFLKIPAHYPDAKALGSTAYYWAGRASERLGKKEQAAEYYRKAGGNGKSTQSKFAQKKAEAVKGANTKSQAINSK